MSADKILRNLLTKWMFSGICLVLAGAVAVGCSALPPTPTAAPTIDITALSAQIEQTLVAKFTRQAPTLEPTATLLPSAVPGTPLPAPAFPTLQLITLMPTPTYKSPAVATPNPGAGAPPALFAVIHVFTSVNHADITNTCPPGYDFKFSADISTNGAGTVIYNWEFSDNSKTDNQTLTFDAAGTQTVTTDWNLGTGGRTPGSNPYKGWARVTIVKPNNQVFTRVSFNFECK